MTTSTRLMSSGSSVMAVAAQGSRFTVSGENAGRHTAM
jgi:hypothetical protein